MLQGGRFARFCLFVSLFYAFEIEEETENRWRRESSRDGLQDSYKDHMLACGVVMPLKGLKRGISKVC